MINASMHDGVRALRWDGKTLHLLDQRQLPFQVSWIACTGVEAVADAIKNLVVRGAPAIGIAAAYGVLLAVNAARTCTMHENHDAFMQYMENAMQTLRQARPTAVHLFYVLDRLWPLLEHNASETHIVNEVQAIEAEDLAANHRMGALGAALITAGSGVLTHCNTGSLATAGFGTALGVIRAAYAQKKLNQVFNTETRPWLQGARLTSWELLQDGIPAQLVADSAGAYLMATGKVQWLLVGADRIAANGDTANKIGTCQLAATARYFGVKVMVVASYSTIDFQATTGDAIIIEHRQSHELLEYAGHRIAPEHVPVCNPAFDVTPRELIDVIVTEKGVAHQPDAENLLALSADCVLV